MSRPSKAIVPAVGVSVFKMSFAVVVLPQPDSPMSPSVSPAWMAKSTPSTALTHAPVRLSNPGRTGKCFFRPRTSSRRLATGHDRFVLGVQEPASGDTLLPDGEVSRLLGRAAGQGLRAPRVERAARRHVGQVRRLTGDRIEGLLAAESGNGAEQGPRIGVAGGVE